MWEFIKRLKIEEGNCEEMRKYEEVLTKNQKAPKKFPEDTEAFEEVQCTNYKRQQFTPYRTFEKIIKRIS